MICTRCIEAVTDIFNSYHSKIMSIELGLVEIQTFEGFDEKEISDRLKTRGFEIIKSDEDIILEKIKVTVTKLFFHDKINENLKNSVWLEKEIGVPYHKLRTIFRDKTGTTIEKYIIAQKIERAKELIRYNQMNFEEISKELGYKNLSHLSNQFKKLEQKSLTQYKNSMSPNRKEINKLL